MCSSQSDLTPFGFFLGFAMTKMNVSAEQAVEFWDALGAFVLVTMQKQDPSATHAALVFDGENGDVVGVELNDQVEG